MEVRFESVVSNCKLIARCFCWCERSFDRHKLNVPSNTARMLHQHYLNVINAITLILDTYLNLLCVWKYVDITLRSTAVVWRLHAILTTQCYLKLMKVTVHKSGPPLQIALTSVSWIVLQCHCVETASKAPFGKWRWLSVKMMLSFASPTNAIVKPLIIVKAAFVSVSLLLRWKLRADSSLGLGFLKKQTVNSS